MAKKKNYEKDLRHLLHITIAVLIILLSIFNLQETTIKENKVLGVNTETLETKLNKESIFWEDFQIKNPTYLDGWVELERFDKVEEIDPNYFIKKNN